MERGGGEKSRSTSLSLSEGIPVGQEIKTLPFPAAAMMTSHRFPASPPPCCFENLNLQGVEENGRGRAGRFVGGWVDGR